MFGSVQLSNSSFAWIQIVKLKGEHCNLTYNYEYIYLYADYELLYQYIYHQHLNLSSTHISINISWSSIVQEMGSAFDQPRYVGTTDWTASGKCGAPNDQTSKFAWRQVIRNQRLYSQEHKNTHTHKQTPRLGLRGGFEPFLSFTMIRGQDDPFSLNWRIFASQRFRIS